MTVVSGLGNKPAESPAVHAIVPGTWLSLRAPAPEPRAVRRRHDRPDRRAPHRPGDAPARRSRSRRKRKAAAPACDGTYGCSYGRTISFRTPTTPLPMEFDPRKVFEKIFGRGNTDAERADIASDYQSVLDMVLGGSPALKSTLGGEDRAHRQRLPRQRARDRAPRAAARAQRDLSNDRPAGRAGRAPELRRSASPDVRPHRRSRYQANMTRIATYMMVAEVSNQSYAHVGVPDAFHPLSHHADNKSVDGEARASCSAITAQVFADFIDKLAADPGRRRRLDARQLDLLVRQQHEQQQPAQLSSRCRRSCSATAAAIKGHQHLRLPGSHAAREPAVHADAARRRARRQSRRQHRRVHGGLIMLDAARRLRAVACAARGGRVPTHCAPRPMLVAARSATTRRPRSPRSRTAPTSTARSADGTTALHWAVYNDNARRSSKRLIAAGADVNAAQRVRLDAAGGSRDRRQRRGLETLLEAGGADVERTRRGRPNALDGRRAQRQHVAAARVLLEHGADVNAREAWREQTALMWAAAQNQPAMVKLLLEHGADADARSEPQRRGRAGHGRERRACTGRSAALTPLLYAAREGCVECARALVEGGADIDLTGLPQGITPLFLMALDNFHFDLGELPHRGRSELEHMGLVGPHTAVLGRRHEHVAARRPRRPAFDGRDDERARSSAQMLARRAPTRTCSSSCCRRIARHRQRPRLRHRCCDWQRRRCCAPRKRSTSRRDEAAGRARRAARSAELTAASRR